MTKTAPRTTTKKTAISPDSGVITFELTVPQADVAKAYQTVLTKAATSVEIKGFRKGKAPIHLVEASLDKNRLYGQVMEIVIPPLYSKAIAASNYQPIIDPRITPIAFEEGKDWQFKVETAGKPVVELGDYKKYVAAALKKVPTETKPEKGHEDHDHSRDHKVSAIFDALLANAKLEVSPLLVEEETRSALSKLVNQLTSLKLTVDDYAKSIKKTSEELLAEYRTTATTNLKLEFILDKLVSVENPTVTTEELVALKAPKANEAYVRYLLQKQKVLDLLLQL